LREKDVNWKDKQPEEKEVVTDKWDRRITWEQ
jgi:hypothetical protein